MQGPGRHGLEQDGTGRGSGDDAGVASSTAVASAAGLPFTGGQSLLLSGLGASLLAAGAGAVLGGRRRTTSTTASATA